LISGNQPPKKVRIERQLDRPTQGTFTVSRNPFPINPQMSSVYQLNLADALKIKKVLENYHGVGDDVNDDYSVVAMKHNYTSDIISDFKEHIPDTEISELDGNDHLVDGFSTTYILFKFGDEFVHLSSVGTENYAETWMPENIFKADCPFDRTTQLRFIRTQFLNRFMDECVIVNVVFNHDKVDGMASESDIDDFDFQFE
jgi:hypothetical protein